VLQVELGFTPTELLKSLMHIQLEQSVRNQKEIFCLTFTEDNSSEIILDARCDVWS